MSSSMDGLSRSADTDPDLFAMAKKQQLLKDLSRSAIPGRLSPWQQAKALALRMVPVNAPPVQAAPPPPTIVQVLVQPGMPGLVLRSDGSLSYGTVISADDTIITWDIGGVEKTTDDNGCAPRRAPCDHHRAPHPL